MGIEDADLLADVEQRRGDLVVGQAMGFADLILDEIRQVVVLYAYGLAESCYCPIRRRVGENFCPPLIFSRTESEEDDLDDDERAKVSCDGHHLEYAGLNISCVQAALREKATAFMGVSKDTTRSQEDIISTPLPGEKLAGFYKRSQEHWIMKARFMSDDRGKALKGIAFELCQNRYSAFQSPSLCCS